ncbi:MAG: hypothetical protein LBH81_02785 [Rickettsiales bacterium]|jgi:hypothetical protein|nr:hypothetical protein [Rickettsiales bacterium]
MTKKLLILPVLAVMGMGAAVAAAPKPNNAIGNFNSACVAVGGEVGESVNYVTECKLGIQATVDACWAKVTALENVMGYTGAAKDGYTVNRGYGEDPSIAPSVTCGASLSL